MFKVNAVILLVSHLSLAANITLPEATSNSTLNHDALGVGLIAWSIVSLTTAGLLFHELHQHRTRNSVEPVEDADIEMADFSLPADPLLPFNNMSPAQNKKSLLVGKRIFVSVLLLGDALGLTVVSAFLAGAANLLPAESGQHSLKTASYVVAGMTVSLLGITASGLFTPLTPKKPLDIAINHIIVPTSLILFGGASIFAASSFFDAGKYTQKPEEEKV
jgi:hypothetical protein